MDTSLEHTHELEPHIRVARARAGVLLLIVSDVLAVLAILAAGGYLRALNTEGQYKIAGDYAPSFLSGLLVMIAVVLSGLFYFYAALALGLSLLGYSVQLARTRALADARRLLFASLVYLPTLLAIMAADKL